MPFLFTSRLYWIVTLADVQKTPRNELRCAWNELTTTMDKCAYNELQAATFWIDFVQDFMFTDFERHRHCETLNNLNFICLISTCNWFLDLDEECVKVHLFRPEIQTRVKKIQFASELRKKECYVNLDLGLIESKWIITCISDLLCSILNYLTKHC